MHSHPCVHQHLSNITATYHNFMYEQLVAKRRTISFMMRQWADSSPGYKMFSTLRALEVPEKPSNFIPDRVGLLGKIQLHCVFDLGSLILWDNYITSPVTLSKLIFK